MRSQQASPIRHAGGSTARLALAAVVVGLSVLVAGAAAAVTTTVDFETGPPLGQPIENDYISSNFVYWVREDPGFRPYRRVAGVATRSGTVAAEVGLEDGDGLTHIFYTRDRRWHVWYGSRRAWTQVGSSRLPVGELLFGEFDDVRETDIAAVANGAWSYSSAARGRWARLNAKRSNSFANAVAANFDGLGNTDIAFGSGRNWRFSRDGTGPLVPLRSGRAVPPYPPLDELLVGHFDGGARATVVGWNRVPRVSPPGFRPGVRLLIWRGLGTDQAFGRLSAQNMR